MEELFCEDCMFIADSNKKDTVFAEIGAALLSKGLVTKAFVPNIIEREKNYPTGVDLEVLNRNLPNVAVPHTESVYVKSRKIIPVKLNHIIIFNNMIQPGKQIPVSFLFIILNNSPTEQANMLAVIMDFLINTNSSELNEFFLLNDTKKMYAFLIKNFKIKTA